MNPFHAIHQWWLAFHVPQTKEQAVVAHLAYISQWAGEEIILQLDRNELRSDRMEAIDWRRIIAYRFHLADKVTIESWAGWTPGWNKRLLEDLGTPEPEDAAARLLEAVWDSLSRERCRRNAKVPLTAPFDRVDRLNRGRDRTVRTVLRGDL